MGYTAPLFGEQYIDTLREATRDHKALRYDDSKAAGRWQPSDLQAGQPLGGEPKGLVSKIEIAQER